MRRCLDRPERLRRLNLLKGGIVSIVFPWHRFGYVIPHRHTDMDGYQFARVAPDGMMMVTTQLNLREYSLAAVEDELPTLREGVSILAQRKVDSLAISGVPLAASLGRKRMLGLLDDLSQSAGIACTTDLETHIEALQALGASSIALGTRWPAELNERIVEYLAEAGITVVVQLAAGRDLARNKDADSRRDHELALSMGRELLTEAGDGAEALLLPGGLWFAINAAPVLEAEFDRAVLLNITSTVWSSLRRHSAPLEVRPETRQTRLFDLL